MDKHKILTLSTDESTVLALYEEHLERVGASPHAFVPTENDGFVSVAMAAARVIGHISVKTQPIVHRKDLPIKLFDMANKGFTDAYPPGLIEGFVQTFGVEEDYRRRGIGSQLQLAAFAECRRRGLYQMRSWSSLDRPANYALKITLGFSLHPGYFYLSKQDAWVAGAYFVKSC